MEGAQLPQLMPLRGGGGSLRIVINLLNWLHNYRTLSRVRIVRILDLAQSARTTGTPRTLADGLFQQMLKQENVGKNKLKLLFTYTFKNM